MSEAGANVVETVAGAAFVEQFDARPDGVWAAPGRVNLIGEHTDYNDGFVLPFALTQRTTVAARRRAEPEWRVYSVNQSDGSTFGSESLVPGAVGGWSGYVAGVVWALRESGADVGGADLVIASDVPVGAGLSSSAALECGVLAALDELFHLSLRPMERVLLAQRAENDYVGMPCGIMDQAAATLCQPGHALLLDCRTHDIEQIPLDAGSGGLALLLVDPHAPHRLVDGEYAARRAGCEAAAATLGLPALRDAVEQDLDRLPESERRLARHVITENARVLATADRLRAGDIGSIGPLLAESHLSLRDDFRVSVPELDVAVDSALAAGALGARMTGGGFGGTIIALARSSDVAAIAAAVRSEFSSRGLAEPDITRTVPSAGAGRLA